MTAPRRRVLRSHEPLSDPRREVRRRRRQESLAREQAACERWFAKLTRAFHEVEKRRRRIARLEREIACDGTS